MAYPDGMPLWQRMGFPDEATFYASFPNGVVFADTPEGRKAAETYGVPPTSQSYPAAYGQPAPPPPPPAGPEAKPTLDQLNARAVVDQFLMQYGLGELSGWAWQQIVNGSTPSQITLQLYDPTSEPGKVVDRIYPELQIRQKKGLPPLSIGDAVAYRDSAIQLMRAAGLPGTFYDQPDDFGRLAGNDVSLAELKDRIDLGQQAAMQAPQDVRDRLQQLYGVDPGGLTAYFLDPERAKPILERQFASAQSSAAAGRSGFGALNQGEAERLVSLGYTPEQVQQMTGVLVRSRELFGVLPGEQTRAIGRGRQLEAAFGGDVSAQEEIERRREERKAQFGGGGGFGASREGVAGLGSAAS